MTRNLLVADDSDADFLFLEKAFELAGLKHKLFRVREGRQAITYLKGEEPFNDRKRWPFPDLVVLDEKMVNGSGFDVLRFLRERKDIAVPAVLLSGSVSPSEIETVLELGAAEYISKPEGVNDLIVMAQMIHHRWLAKR
jgi:CheY-like chemotaxis protein